jgi:hypothetical protein
MRRAKRERRCGGGSVRAEGQLTTPDDKPEVPEEDVPAQRVLVVRIHVKAARKRQHRRQPATHRKEPGRSRHESEPDRPARCPAIEAPERSRASRSTSPPTVSSPAVLPSSQNAVHAAEAKASPAATQAMSDADGRFRQPSLLYTKIAVAPDRPGGNLSAGAASRWVRTQPTRRCADVRGTHNNRPDRA